MSKEIRVLSADAYDYLELSALAFGGIGAHAFGKIDRQGEEMNADRGELADGAGVPCCVWGHAATASAGDPYANEVAQALLSAGINYTTNDAAVETINARRGKPSSSRVPFKTYARKLGIVRGDA